MKKTISVMVGAGSVSHNERKFIAENVDPDRVHLNICYCNDKIKDVYHELFDGAVKRYNTKQTRKDRRIDNYYEKIRSGKQEKLFHEIIVQVGNREDSSVVGEDGTLVAQVLGKYMENFQKRNPNLRVFSAHLHMDEATPHLHIDYVPFTANSKRGLDTRVSMKKALEAKGFVGKGKSDTEWSQWVQSEKQELAKVMECHGIEWEQKCTHEKHLSVLDYKKEMRQQEIEECETKIENLHAVIENTNDEATQAKERLQAYNDKADEIINKTNLIDTKEEFALPEPAPMASAKEYSETEIKPLISRFKGLIRSLVSKYNDLLGRYNNLIDRYNEQQPKIARLFSENIDLRNDNVRLKKMVRNFESIKDSLGTEKFNTLAKQANRNKGKDNRRDVR